MDITCTKIEINGVEIKKKPTVAIENGRGKVIDKIATCENIRERRGETTAEVDAVVTAV